MKTKKTIITLLLLLIEVHFGFSQEKVCDCINELDNVSELIKNAKSYQTQIVKEHKETEFEDWKEIIKHEITNDSLNQAFCTGYLQKYISFIHDRHNEIYTIPSDISTFIPNYTKAIDTIKIKSDGISGIYFAGREKILLINDEKNTWYGVMVSSNSEKWKEGKIRLKLNKLPNGKFELFEFYQNGLLYYQNNIEVKNSRIYSTFWNKENNYFFNKNHEKNFTYQSINPSFDYIGIKTLSRTTNLMKEAENFYNENLSNLNKENLIIDLRNNGGGATKQAEALLKYLKKNHSIKRIYVMINFKTGSSAELITLDLKKDNRTIIVGENSRGMLKYGYGNKAFSATTNCAKYKMILSTKIINKDFDKFEYTGIQPDYYLDNKSDWIQQIMKINDEKI